MLGPKKHSDDVFPVIRKLREQLERSSTEIKSLIYEWVTKPSKLTEQNAKHVKWQMVLSGSIHGLEKKKR